MLSLSLTALAATAFSVSAETMVAVLEFGPGGSVHRTTSTAVESNSAAVSSLWTALHRPSSKRSPKQYAGMTVVPDLFTKPHAGIVIELQGDSVKSMPTAMSLLDGEIEGNVVGHMSIRGQAGAELMKRASSENVDVVSKEDMGRRLQSVAETAARGAIEGIEALTLAVENDEAAAVADEQLGRMLKTLKKQADASGKTVVVHLVAESNRRRLDEGDENADGENQNQNQYAWNERTMYEIQTYNLFLWSTVGLVVLLSFVLSAFIAMPLMPDTLLFGEAVKIAD